MTKAKQLSAEYFDATAKQKLVDRFIEFKRHKRMIEAELDAILEAVISNPEAYEEFTVVRQNNSYVPKDVIKAYVGEEWIAENTVTAPKKPWLKLKA